MDQVLGNDELYGAHSVRVRLRPPRDARPVPIGDVPYFLDAARLACQLWAGAATPLIPVTGEGLVDPLYSSTLRGADIDRFVGASLGTYTPETVVEIPEAPHARWGAHFAPVAFMDRQEDKPTLVCPVLDPTDPWAGIYASCLGALPTVPDAALLQHGEYLPDLTFEQFFDVSWEGVTGSLDDLLRRLEDPHALSARALTMSELAYGWAPNTGIRSGGGSSVLQGRYLAADAGANIVVVCKPGDVRDLALLWNLRAAHGDSYGVPIGVLVDDFDADLLSRLLRSGLLCRQGIPEHALYVTSASLDVNDLRGAWSPASTETVGNRESGIAFVSAHELVTIGPAPSRLRDEVVTWTDGRAAVISSTPDDRSALSWDRPRGATLMMDVAVTGSPFPRHPQVRAGMSMEFFAGTATRGAKNGPIEPTQVFWPSRLVMLKVVVQRRRLTVKESEAGIACMTLLRAMGSVHQLSRLAHAPLLALLGDLAARQGTAWAKAHSRADHAIEGAIAPTVDDLPDASIDLFRKALGSPPTAAVRGWMTWAEQRRLLVKGFRLSCERCGARQWIPVSGYRPPIACTGCGELMEQPFPNESVSFTWRISEALRRVYEQDAMGHLLTMRYLARILSSPSSLIGTHPGIDVTRGGASTRLGEADVMVLLGDGACVPMEVKRSFAGVTTGEMAKLSALSEALESPWDAFVVTEYAIGASTAAHSTAARTPAIPAAGQMDSSAPVEAVAAKGESSGVSDTASQRPRFTLTYDHLLDPHPMWGLGTDPFNLEPLTSEAIVQREKDFTKSLTYSDRSRFGLEEELLYERGGYDGESDADGSAEMPAKSSG